MIRVEINNRDTIKAKKKKKTNKTKSWFFEKKNKTDKL